MSLRPLASLLVKMLGLYAFVHALPQISVVLGSFGGSPSSFPGVSPLSLALFHSLGGALQMLVGVGLWWFSDNIAHSAVPEDGEIPVQHAGELTTVGFSVVGAYLLADFVVKLVGYGSRLYTLNQSGLGAGATGVGLMSVYREFHLGADTFIPILVQGVLGLSLLLGPRKMVRTLANFKNVGRDLEVEEANEFKN